MQSKLYYDTETCGLHGPIVFIQYAVDDGPVVLYSPWKHPVIETMKLIEWFMEMDNIGFNLAFDHFHLCQFYTVLCLINDKDAILEDCIKEYAEKEKDGRNGLCLKPKRAMDIMLHARKGPYQSLMSRKPITIRRVPSILAFELAEELEKRIPIPDIYFARRKNKQKWTVLDIKDNDQFKDVKLKFAPKSALKTLATHALKLDPSEVLTFGDIELSDVYNPVEYGWAPFNQGKGAWPDVIHHHIAHWEHHTLARKYAAKDVEYTRALYKHFGEPEPGDDDSELACLVGAVRWRGYAIDVEGIKKLKAEAELKLKTTPIAPGPVKRYIHEKLDATELIGIGDSTAKAVLEQMVNDLECCDEETRSNCSRCGGSGVHPAASRAREVLDARFAKKEIELYDKLLFAGRFHASFVVIGTLSSRMAGTDKLNPQAIKATKEVRRCFPLADGKLELWGGDFDSFELSLMDADYDDPQLREDLLSGVKVHAIFGTYLSGWSYDEVVASAKTDNDWYTKGKRGVFALGYGGNEHTIVKRIEGCTIERAEFATKEFFKRYRVSLKKREQTTDLFCSMKQPGGLGTKVVWHDPIDKIESIFGFARYFTLENQVCKALFDLASDPPAAWKALKIKVVRRDRDQFVTGAVQSALLAAAFAIQGSNMRAGANHRIQASGAFITKRVQRKIWDIQPSGVSDWLVQPMNIHDEILAPTRPDKIEEVASVVNETVESFREKVPVIGMKWQRLTTWADK